MAASLTLRVPTGVPLTNAQVDNNFSQLNAFGNTINSNVGILSNLTTTATGNIVVSINEIKGGNLSQFGSTTSAQLASIISDETGSGALVFATSPTLVTPILGTPTSGALTNCTFPTLNQNTTGSAATLTTSRNINGVAFNGSADITVPAAAGTLTGSTLASGVTLSSLTQVGTISFGAWNGSSISTTYTDAKVTSVNSSTGAVTGLATTAGTLAQFGATTSAQLLSIISDETGTGALVFANSPTLINPALGTPFSGNLANCTFPTLNQNTSGSAASLSATLAVASGGTGVTSSTGTTNVVLSNSPTLTNPTITNYVETPFSANSGTAITLALTNGTVQIITLTGNATITMPTAVSGKSFTILLRQDATGSRTVTWPTVTNPVSWPAATAPTITSTASKMDKYVFISDGTYWYGATAGQNYT